MSGIVQIAVEVSVRASLVAASIGVILVLCRVRSGAVRHAAWTAALAAMMLMPLVPRLAPPVSLPVQMPAPMEVFVPIVPEPVRPMPVTIHTPTPAAESELLPIRGSIWPVIGYGLYGFVLGLLLVRLAIGWRGARRIALAAEPVVAPKVGQALCACPTIGVQVYESAIVTVPLTIGVVSPRIVLPRAWKDWPAAKLRAVLAHEAAHVRRRDAIVSLIAQVNRCVFWFHPLAWWLERKIALTAEQACDEAALREGGTSREYAETLLDMVETVRRNGARWSWQGAGMHGAGALSQRIDRILRGDIARLVSRRRKFVVAAGVAVAIVIIAACRLQRPSAEALAQAEERDRKNRESVARGRTQEELWKSAAAMSREQVAALEAEVRRNPANLEARRKLLMFYSQSGEKVLGAAETIAARLPHFLWLIAHHPEDQLAAWWWGPYDPKGYATAKSAWLAQADLDVRPVAVYSNAANFFTQFDKPLAERMLLRAQAAQPGAGWSARFGRLYYAVLTGPDAKSEYATRVRKTLEESKDPRLLFSVGQALIIRERPGNNPGFDQAALGRKYVERALQLNPDLPGAQSFLAWEDQKNQREKLMRCRSSSLDLTYQEIAGLPDAERLRCLAHLAEWAYMQGESADYYKHDTAGAKAFWEQSRKYGREALELAAKLRDDLEYPAAYFKSNMALGMVTMRGGDTRGATRYMLDAVKAPVTRELRISYEYFPQKLVTAILQAAERNPVPGILHRNAVAEFLERYAEINTSNKERWLDAALLIRAGKTPFWAEL